MKFREKVFNTVKKIPEGKVATYAQIAEMINKPKAARAVGNALNKNYDPKVPCHRVVHSDGSVGGFRKGTLAKVTKLKKEGIVIVNGRIELGKYRF
ncbi:MAG: MGMT family protein [Patescibacteria group bacterium]